MRVSRRQFGSCDSSHDRVAKNTIAKLLVELGAACSDYMDKNLRNLKCERIQCDEIWSFVAAKERNVTPKLVSPIPRLATAGRGSEWMPTRNSFAPWQVGRRDWITADQFVGDLRSRLANRVQLTTDGNRLYLFAINTYFEKDVDYAVLMKLYGGSTSPTAEVRYSPAECVGWRRNPRLEDPDPKHISTSYVERQNLTMRMSIRRFTRLTNAFSRKIENHVASLAIHDMHYNFVRIHQTLRITPAMAAGVTDRLWDVNDLVGLLG